VVLATNGYDVSGQNGRPLAALTGGKELKLVLLLTHGRNLLELACAGRTPGNMQIPQIFGDGFIYGTSHQLARCG